jgi:hypothetical protein
VSVSRVGAEVERAVRARAAGLCEYCHADERWQYVRFTLDHVRARAAGGSDDPENLALSCFHCNRHKSDRAASIDPESGAEVALFDPRTARWADHFRWSSDRLRVEGVTPVGRATVVALRMNRERVPAVRHADLSVGRHPPPGDPVADVAPDAD